MEQSISYVAYDPPKPKLRVSELNRVTIRVWSANPKKGRVGHVSIQTHGPRGVYASFWPEDILKQRQKSIAGVQGAHPTTPEQDELYESIEKDIYGNDVPCPADIIIDLYSLNAAEIEHNYRSFRKSNLNWSIWGSNTKFWSGGARNCAGLCEFLLKKAGIYNSYRVSKQDPLRVDDDIVRRGDITAVLTMAFLGGVSGGTKGGATGAIAGTIAGAITSIPFCRISSRFFIPIFSAFANLAHKKTFGHQDKYFSETDNYMRWAQESDLIQGAGTTAGIFIPAFLTHNLINQGEKPNIFRQAYFCTILGLLSFQIGGMLGTFITPDDVGRIAKIAKMHEERYELVFDPPKNSHKGFWGASLTKQNTIKREHKHPPCAPESWLRTFFNTQFYIIMPIVNENEQFTPKTSNPRGLVL